MSDSIRYFSRLHDYACDYAQLAGREGNVRVVERWLRVADRCLAIEERLIKVLNLEDERFAPTEHAPNRPPE